MIIPYYNEEFERKFLKIRKDRDFKLELIY